MEETQMRSPLIQRDKINNFLAVIIGAFLTGVLWSIRGDNAYGSSWGMFTVALVFSAFIFAYFGERQKLNFAFLGLTAFLTGITAAGWGTLNGQITGYVSDFNGASTVNLEINPLSGVFIMLCLGFGWLPFFAFMMSRFFSDKKYKIRDLIGVIVVFYAVSYLCKASVSHGILQLLHPQTGKLFTMGLLQQGILKSPYAVYMEHFSNIPWGKKIFGGRNYFTSVETVSHALAALATILFVRFKIKDKFAAKLMLLINTAMALSITVADIALYITDGGYHLKQFAVSQGTLIYDLTSRNLLGWCAWEYMTGFFFGLLTMIIFVSICRKKLDQSATIKDETFERFGLKMRGTISFFFFGTFCNCLLLLRPASQNFNQDSAVSVNVTLLRIILGVIFEAIVLVVFLKLWKKYKNGTLSDTFYSKSLFFGYILWILYFYIVDIFVAPKEYRFKLADHTRFDLIWFEIISIGIVIALSMIMLYRSKKIKSNQ